MFCRPAIALALGMFCLSGSAADLVPPELLRSKLSYPVAGDAGYVLIEISPTAKDITLNAYFLSDIIQRNWRLCDAVKASLDREAASWPREQGRPFNSYRMCLSLKDAVRLGYMWPRDLAA